MSSNGRQYDPAAAAASSALDASQRSLRQVRSQVDAPELPAESQAFTGARNAVQTVSQFSPANVAARGDSPVPSPNEVTSQVDLPGMDSMSVPQSVEDLMPNQVLNNAPDPLGVLPSSGNSNRRNRDQNSGSNNGNGNSNNGSSSSGRRNRNGSRQRRR